MFVCTLPASALGQSLTPPFDLNDPAFIEKGRTFFNRRCNGYCHGRDARTGIDGPSLRGRDDLTALFVFVTIFNGRAGTAMPPWKDRISEEEMWLATAFLMSIQAGKR